MRFRFRTAAPHWFERPGRWMLVSTLGLVAAIVTAELLSPPTVHLGPLLVVAPAVTATYASARQTGVVGAFAVLVLLGVGLYRTSPLSENLVVQLCALAVLTVLLMVFCALRERRERELNRAWTVAEATQRVLLRPLPHRAGPLSIASRYRAAEADTRIGGDLFACARTPHGTRLMIGDVSGRGLSSLSDTAMLLGAFRAAAHREASLPDLVRYLEGSVRWAMEEADETPDRARRAPAGRGADEDPVAQRHPAERFVTAAVLDIPDDEPLVRMVNCGHPPPLLLRGGDAEPLITPDPAPPLGLGGLLRTRYDVLTHPFGPGDLLLLYTDGLTEARDPAGVFYPLPDRAPRWAAEGTEGLLSRLARDVAAYTARPLDDDLAMVAVRRDRG
ncbi:PP2C family protein-serine/threonine phosphatase [Streptantibioticus silvisoli]|jgi:hypothetical protein|uniref:PP2C family protein-serine/threonine phosphatase n=1 Tax=Streptantibioticus silvisoli TaxID=2705255 RepID=A0ABT6W6Y7_9ACTN|nr:PP2C family protein-serine/threonine phosphatase [Streptantibioticus silvisoli]MDI5966064.1 PP2C family protein-serine/threonine phosphatase [Streptantibioticus silvisoli]